MSESALVRSVRDRIRAHEADPGPPIVLTYLNRQVEVEFDEQAPATAADLFVIVTFGGVEPGPTHNTAGGVIDKLYGVDVTIAIRSPGKPRDRQRELWISLASSFEVHQRNIEAQIDFDYQTLTDANVFITAETPPPKDDPFIEPLKFAGAGPIRQAPAEVFAGFPGEPTAALIRTIRFRGARRIENR